MATETTMQGNEQSDSADISIGVFSAQCRYLIYSTPSCLLLLSSTLFYSTFHSYALLDTLLLLLHQPCYLSHSLNSCCATLCHAVRLGTNMGDDPISGRPVMVRSGRFGRYMQIGLDAEKNRTTHSLPQWLHNSAPLEEVLEFARLPRFVN